MKNLRDVNVAQVWRNERAAPVAASLEQLLAEPALLPTLAACIDAHEPGNEASFLLDEPSVLLGAFAEHAIGFLGRSNCRARCTYWTSTLHGHYAHWQPAWCASPTRPDGFVTKRDHQLSGSNKGYDYMLCLGMPCSCRSEL